MQHIDELLVRKERELTQTVESVTILSSEDRDTAIVAGTIGAALVIVFTVVVVIVWCSYHNYPSSTERVRRKRRESGYQEHARVRLGNDVSRQ